MVVLHQVEMLEELTHGARCCVVFGPRGRGMVEREAKGAVGAVPVWDAKQVKKARKFVDMLRRFARENSARAKATGKDKITGVDALDPSTASQQVGSPAAPTAPAVVEALAAE